MDNVRELEELVDAVIHTPERTGAAMKHLSELMDKHRVEHPEVFSENHDSAAQDDYDPYTGKYAFVSSDDDIDDEECENAAREVHDELVRSLIEAGGEMREAKELLIRSLEMLYILGYDSGFTNLAIDTLTTDIKKFLEETQ